LKADDEVISAASTSTQGITAGIVANTIVVASKPPLPTLSEVLTKKNFNVLVIESGVLDGNWNRTDIDIVEILKKDTRFKAVVQEKLARYKSRPVNSLVLALKGVKAKQEDVFTHDQKRRESLWIPDASNLNYLKETFQLQTLLEFGNLGDFCIQTVQAGGTADIALTTASAQKDWSEKLKLTVYLPIEAKSTFKSRLSQKQRSHTINGLAGHPESSFPSTSMTHSRILVFSLSSFPRKLKYYSGTFQQQRLDRLQYLILPPSAN
jgi:hypothetical protein